MNAIERLFKVTTALSARVDVLESKMSSIEQANQGRMPDELRRLASEVSDDAARKTPVETNQ